MMVGCRWHRWWRVGGGWPDRVTCGREITRMDETKTRGRVCVFGGGGGGHL